MMGTKSDKGDRFLEKVEDRSDGKKQACCCSEDRSIVLLLEMLYE